MNKFIEQYSLKRREENLESYRVLVKKVLSLRKKGMSFQAIAIALGLNSRSYTHGIYHGNAPKLLEDPKEIK